MGIIMGGNAQVQWLCSKGKLHWQTEGMLVRLTSLRRGLKVIPAGR